MIKRQTARFLFRPISGLDRGFMASLLHGSCTIDAFSKSLHFLLQPTPLPSTCNYFPSPSLVKLPIDDTCNGFRINRSIGLTFCSNPKTSVDIKSLHKIGAFAPYPRLHSDLDIDLQEDRDDVRLANGSGSSQRGTPLEHPLPEKIVVAVDVDEVLGNFVSALNRFIADRYSLNHSVSEYHVYEFFKIWKCSRDEADFRVHEFFKTSYFKTGIHPIPGAQQALHKLSSFCNLSVVTSRQNAIKDHTIEWIENHYPGMFQEIHFGNHFALHGESRPKSDICRSLGAKVLIDDNPRYAIECAEIGIRVLLFDYENSYPWCKTDSINQHPLVTKVHNWEEVEQQLVSLIV